MKPSRLAKRLLVPALLAGALLLAQSVLAAPPTDVAISPTAPPTPGGCGQYTFNGTATDVDGDIAASEWDFAYDGTFNAEATGLGPVPHTYGTVGSRTVALRVTDGDVGDPVTDPPVDDPDEVIVTQTVDVTNPNTPTAAIAATPPEAQIGQAIEFSAAGSTDPDGGPLTYQWDIDGAPGFDAGRTGATETLPSGYPSKGVRIVKVRVTDNCGAWEEASASVDVDNTLPNAVLNVAPNPVAVGQAVTFDASASNDPGNGGSIVEYAWDLDGQPGFELPGGTDPKVTRTYSTAGTILAAVRVKDDDGGTHTAFQLLTINALPVFIPNQPPQASFTVAPANPVEGNQVTFASTSSDPDGPIVKQEWDLNNDGTYERAGGVVSTSSLKKGTRPVRLRVTDSRGATATSLVSVKVAAKPLKNPPDINSTVSWSPRAGGITLVSLTVKVPSNTSVAVSCKGGGCPRGTFHKHSKKKKGARLTFGQLEGRLSAGAKISVIFTRPGYMTGWDTIKIRGRGKDRIVQLEGCRIRGAKTQKRCP